MAKQVEFVLKYVCCKVQHIQVLELTLTDAVEEDACLFKCSQSFGAAPSSLGMVKFLCACQRWAA